MFTSPLHKTDYGVQPVLSDSAHSYYMTDYGYGKRWMRVFELDKSNAEHKILEYKVSVHSRLTTHKEYLNADNSDVVGSDVQETNVYLHAQKYGLRTPEEFALSLSAHFLENYALIATSNVLVEKVNWERLGVLEKGAYKDTAHNHAFVRDTNCTRYCEVLRKHNEPAILISGLKGLRIVKTAKAPFTGYLKDKNLFTEGDQADRILCVEVQARWQYASFEGIDFNKSWAKVRDLILQSFAGDAVEGVIITSVQSASHLTERAVLDAMPEIKSISIVNLNYPHLPYDYSRFPDLAALPHVVICNPKEEPTSFGYAQTDRGLN